MEWNDLVQGTDRRRALVNVEPSGSIRCGEFLD